MNCPTLEDLAETWADTPEAHEEVLLSLDRVVDSVPELARQRRWCEENQYGFGHKSFSGVWYLLARSLPDGFKFLEVGIHRGQSLSAVELATHLCGKTCDVYGLGPLNGVGGYYELRDYAPDVEHVFATFNGDRRPTLIRGLAADPAAKRTAAAAAPFDVVYVDADHGLEDARHDLRYYGGLVRPGGYLVADDAACGLNLFGWAFKGFPGASHAADEWLPPKTPNPDWAHVTNVMHLRIWKRL